MKKLLLLFALLFSITCFSQDKTKKTNFQFLKSIIIDDKIGGKTDIKQLKEKDFEDDERIITIRPTDQSVVFDLGFVEKTIKITEEKFSLIDKQWVFQLRDSNFAFLVIGDEYAIIRLEEDKRTLILITDQFNFKK